MAKGKSLDKFIEKKLKEKLQDPSILNIPMITLAQLNEQLSLLEGSLGDKMDSRFDDLLNRMGFIEQQKEQKVTDEVTERDKNKLEEDEDKQREYVEAMEEESKERKKEQQKFLDSLHVGLSNIGASFKKTASNITSSIKSHTKETLKNIFSKDKLGAKEVMMIMGALAALRFLDSKIPQIKDKVEDVKEYIEPVISKLQEYYSDIKSVVSNIWDKFTDFLHNNSYFNKLFDLLGISDYSEGSIGESLKGKFGENFRSNLGTGIAKSTSNFAADRWNNATTNAGKAVAKAAFFDNLTGAPQVIASIQDQYGYLDQSSKMILSRLLDLPDNTWQIDASKSIVPHLRLAYASGNQDLKKFADNYIKIGGYDPALFNLSKYDGILEKVNMKEFAKENWDLNLDNPYSGDKSEQGVINYNEFEEIRKANEVKRAEDQSSRYAALEARLNEPTNIHTAPDGRQRMIREGETEADLRFQDQTGKDIYSVRQAKGEEFAQDWARDIGYGDIYDQIEREISMEEISGTQKVGNTNVVSSQVVNLGDQQRTSQSDTR